MQRPHIGLYTIIALTVGGFTGYGCYLIRHVLYPGPGDFNWAISTARDLLQHRDPYNFVAILFFQRLYVFSGNRLAPWFSIPLKSCQRNDNNRTTRSCLAYALINELVPKTKAISERSIWKR